MKTPLLTLLLVSLLALSNCKKEETTSPSSPAPKTKTELLTNGNSKNWKLISSLFNGNENIQDCEKDNTYTFDTKGNYILDYGINKCSSSEPEKANNTWEFKDDETKMQWVTTLGTFDLDILELTENKLKVKQESSGGGMNFTFELTFEAK